MRNVIKLGLSGLLPLLLLILAKKWGEKRLQRHLALRALHAHFALSPREIKKHDDHMRAKLSPQATAQLPFGFAIVQRGVLKTGERTVGNKI